MKHHPNQDVARSSFDHVDRNMAAYPYSSERIKCQPAYRQSTFFRMGIMALMWVLVIPISSIAQTTDHQLPKQWGAEFSAVGIGVFSLYQGKLTYALRPSSQFKTELGLGFLIQPEANRAASAAFNGDGLYSANQASVAVRQYLWRGLHLEEVINLGPARIRNSEVDGNDYESFVVFTQTFLGYKLDILKRDGFNLFLIGQAGLGYVPLSTDRWPRVDPNGSPVYPLGDLKVGINF